jgi:misacylated tRNA(Ala) deacylase
MTTLIYQSDGYLRSSHAQVVSVRGDAVTLDRTIFFPGSADQEADGGKLLWQGYVARVERLERHVDEVRHWLIGPRPAVGQYLRCKINWQRRYRLMRLHTALHMVSGVMMQDFTAKAVRAKMVDGTGYVDFMLEGFAENCISRVERCVNEQVTAGMATATAGQPPFLQMAVRQQPDDALNADLPAQSIVQSDCGIYVRNTVEVGRLSLCQRDSDDRRYRRLTVALQSEDVAT